MSKRTTKDIIDEMDAIYIRMKTLGAKSVTNNDQKDAPNIKAMDIELRVLHQEVIYIHNKEIQEIERFIQTLDKYSVPSN
jgi:hypothetical protein